jgi:hypothetical protein
MQKRRERHFFEITFTPCGVGREDKFFLSGAVSTARVVYSRITWKYDSVCLSGGKDRGRSSELNRRPFFRCSLGEVQESCDESRTDQKFIPLLISSVLLFITRCETWGTHGGCAHCTAQQHAEGGLFIMLYLMTPTIVIWWALKLRRNVKKDMSSSCSTTWESGTWPRWTILDIKFFSLRSLHYPPANPFTWIKIYSLVV